MTSSKQNKSNVSITKVDCKFCDLFGVLRLLGNLVEEEPGTVEQILRREVPVSKGETLFQTGDTFRAVYAVKSGSFKSFTWLNGGGEQVVGFHFPGELLGLDSVRSPRYGYCARALEQSNVCLLKFDELDLLGERLPQFQEQLIQLLSKQIMMEQRQSLVVSQQSAEERLAAFLINLSRRFQERGLPSVEFHIAMSRQDIANYLGLALESVSRLFTRFQEQGMLKVSGKLVVLTDLTALEALLRTPATMPVDSKTSNS